ncbi:MAG: glycosyltransferase [Candidatus Zixiibacteriota bacterium]
MNLLSLLLLAGALFGLAYTAISWLLLVSASRKKSENVAPLFIPPISVFKPLKGLDENLAGNLETFFRQDYPNFELIFGVNDLDDPAISVVRKLQSAYPHIATKLVIDTHRVGYNPKVNNLCNMSKQASFDYWVISDSNVRVHSRYLLNFVGHMRDQRIGLVTSIIRGVGGRRLGAKLENLHLNSFVAASTIAVNRLSTIPISIGKSMLLRRETIAQLGGFEAFSNYLLEDGLIGRAVRGLGLKTATSMDAIDNVNDTWSVRDFFNRHYRWGLMRRQLNIGHYTGEILSNPIFLALAAVAASPSALTASLLGLVCASKVALDLMTIRSVGGEVKVSSAFLLPLKDLVIATVWWKPFFTNRVSWRGNQFRIGAMTRISPVDSVSFKPQRISSIRERLSGHLRLTRRSLIPWSSEA